VASPTGQYFAQITGTDGTYKTAPFTLSNGLVIQKEAFPIADLKMTGNVEITGALDVNANLLTLGTTPGNLAGITSTPSTISVLLPVPIPRHGTGS
jgi:hypothetical protein